MLPTATINKSTSLCHLFFQFIEKYLKNITKFLKIDLFSPIRWQLYQQALEIKTFT
jgi:hypothetical protein